jgi:predicted enzyme related to lactoylglutathione lyase
VATLDDSIAQVESQGGWIAGDIRDARPGSRFVIIEDPSGAKEALIEFQQP